ncbi:MAG: aminotransferase class V-fold PLP-dependent enzyme [Candidatus Omnitrophica bacterium]|nr:aminotransferase class V-fold PLP-dependent enzyme [Candidatus Omnitrophota bacterium]
MKKPIYLDCHSTTPMDPRVIRVMSQALKETFGNAASTEHRFGQAAEALVEKNRKSVADLIHAHPEEIIFTSGATESNNLAIKGIFEIYHDKGSHIVTQVTEHKSVLDTCRYLETKSAQVTYLKVDSRGSINLQELEKTITRQTILISIMMANNEIGTRHPIEKIGALAKSRGIFFHVDAAQTAGKIPIDVQKMGIDLLSFSGHKMYGPKGIGALYVRRQNPRVRLAPLLHGGGHEHGLRSGTLNVPAIVGFGKACEIAKREMKADALRIQKLREEFYAILNHELDGISLNGHPKERLHGNLNLSFEGTSSAELLRLLSDHLAVSTGSACATKSPEPSYVLKAVGIAETQLHSSIRFGLGRFTTRAEIHEAARRIIEAVKKVRKASPFYRVQKG